MVPSADVARACGLNRDLRRDHPYAHYADLPLSVTTLNEGDAYLPLNITAVAAMIAERTRVAPTIPRGFYAHRRAASAQSDLSH